MSLESDIFDTLRSLVPNDCVWPDKPRDNTTAQRYIVYQQVGGEAINYLEATQPGKRNARVQFASWAKTRQAASDLGRAVETALIESDLVASVLGAFVATYDSETKLYGTRQDFSIWY